MHSLPTIRSLLVDNRLSSRWITGNPPIEASGNLAPPRKLNFRGFVVVTSNLPQRRFPCGFTRVQGVCNPVPAGL